VARVSDHRDRLPLVRSRARKRSTGPRSVALFGDGSPTTAATPSTQCAVHLMPSRPSRDHHSGSGTLDAAHEPHPPSPTPVLGSNATPARSTALQSHALSVTVAGHVGSDAEDPFADQSPTAAIKSMVSGSGSASGSSSLSEARSRWISELAASGSPAIRAPEIASR